MRGKYQYHKTKSVKDKRGKLNSTKTGNASTPATGGSTNQAKIAAIESTNGPQHELYVLQFGDRRLSSKMVLLRQTLEDWDVEWIKPFVMCSKIDANGKKVTVALISGPVPEQIRGDYAEGKELRITNILLICPNCGSKISTLVAYAGYNSDFSAGTLYWMCFQCPNKYWRANQSLLSRAALNDINATWDGIYEEAAPGMGVKFAALAQGNASDFLRVRVGETFAQTGKMLPPPEEHIGGRTTSVRSLLEQLAGLPVGTEDEDAYDTLVALHPDDVKPWDGCIVYQFKPLVNTGGGTPVTTPTKSSATGSAQSTPTTSSATASSSKRAQKTVHVVNEDSDNGVNGGEDSSSEERPLGKGKGRALLKSPRKKIKLEHGQNDSEGSQTNIALKKETGNQLKVNRVVCRDGTVSRHVVLPDGTVEMLLTKDESSREDESSGEDDADLKVSDLSKALAAAKKKLAAMKRAETERNKKQASLQAAHGKVALKHESEPIEEVTTAGPATAPATVVATFPATGAASASSAGPSMPVQTEDVRVVCWGEESNPLQILVKNVPQACQLEKMKLVCALMDLDYGVKDEFDSYQIHHRDADKCGWCPRTTWNFMWRNSQTLLIKAKGVNVSEKSLQEEVMRVRRDMKPHVAVDVFDAEDQYAEADE